MWYISHQVFWQKFALMKWKWMNLGSDFTSQNFIQSPHQHWYFLSIFVHTFADLRTKCHETETETRKPTCEYVMTCYWWKDLIVQNILFENLEIWNIHAILIIDEQFKSQTNSNPETHFLIDHHFLIIATEIVSILNDWLNDLVKFVEQDTLFIIFWSPFVQCWIVIIDSDWIIANDNEWINIVVSCCVMPCDIIFDHGILIWPDLFCSVLSCPPLSSLVYSCLVLSGLVLSCLVSYIEDEVFWHTQGSLLIL
jgi:hypothetical protein